MFEVLQKKVTGSRQRDGQEFTYEVAFTAKSFVGVVRIDGDLAGRPQISIFGDLPPGALESMARAWIQGCIDDRVGVR